MRLNLKRKGLYHSSSGLHYYITKTINSIRKRILGQKSPVRISIEKGFVLICGGSNPSSSSFLRCFQVSEANGSWNHLSSRHQGVSCFFAAVQFSCFFVQQKCSISKWLACFGSQSSKVTLSNINLSSITMSFTFGLFCWKSPPTRKQRRPQDDPNDPTTNIHIFWREFAWPWLPRASMCLKHPRGFARIAIFGGVVHCGMKKPRYPGGPKTIK